MAKLLIFLSFILWGVPDQDKMVKTNVTESIKVLLPQNFYAMSPQDIAQRYPSVRKPIGAYTDASRFVDFSVNISATQWREQDVEIAREFFKASLLNLYDKVKMLQEDVKVINKKKYITFEFESRIEGDQMSLEKKDAIRTYTYIQYLIINGKTIVFSFNCPVRFKDKWQSVAPEIMNSIKVSNSI